MLITTLILIAGLLLLFLGGETLVKGACALAVSLRVPSLTIGLTVVAFGTSMPEMVVSIDASLAGANDIAIGNVVGSNIANITLILGIAAWIYSSETESKLLRIDAPFMTLMSAILLVALIDERLSRLEGSLFVLGLLAFVGFTFWFTQRTNNAVASGWEETDYSVPAPLILAVFRIAIGLSGLILGGHLVVDSAVRIAVDFGLSQAVVGLTVVAIGTSLPELATSVIAALRREGNIAIGNVVGSNIFNILGILGVTAMINPVELGGITWFDLWLMLALAGILVGLLFRKAGIGRLAGLLLLASFAAYESWLLIN